MKFAEKCPKCGGNIQTKSIRKSIGLGFVEIPVAQFCLNPVCDWYQDFSEAKKPEEIKENVIQIKVPSIKNKLPDIKKPALSQKHIIALGGIIGAVVIYFLLSTILTYSPGYYPQPQQPESNKTNTTVTNTPNVSAALSAQTPAVGSLIPRKYSVKMDVTHGFNPRVIGINRSDTVVWNNEENQRPRVILISKDGLFENKRMEYSEKFPYQFNHSGNYTFVLAEFPSLKEYPNAVGNVLVK